MFTKYVNVLLVDRRVLILKGKENFIDGVFLSQTNEISRFNLSWKKDCVILRTNGKKDSSDILYYFEEKIGSPLLRCIFQGFFSKQQFYFWFLDLVEAKILYDKLCIIDSARKIRGKKRGWRDPKLLD